MYLHDQLDKIAWKVATLLEEIGYDSIPMPSLGPVELMERGGISADISHRHAAVQAGLGRIVNIWQKMNPLF